MKTLNQIAGTALILVFVLGHLAMFITGARKADFCGWPTQPACVPPMFPGDVSETPYILEVK